MFLFVNFIRYLNLNPKNKRKNKDIKIIKKVISKSDGRKNNTLTALFCPMILRFITSDLIYSLELFSYLSL